MSNSIGVTARRQRVDLLHLHGDVGIDEVVGEDAAAGQELAVTVKIFERLIKRRTDGRNLGVFLRRQIVEVLVGRFAGWILFWMPSRPAISRAEKAR